MRFPKDFGNEEREAASLRIEQLDLLRRLSYIVIPRANRSLIKTFLFIIGLLADRDTGEELFKIVKRFY